MVIDIVVITCLFNIAPNWSAKIRFWNYWHLEYKNLQINKSTENNLKRFTPFW